MALTPLAVLSLALSALPLLFALVFIHTARIRTLFFPAVLLGLHFTVSSNNDITVWTWSALLAAISSDLLIISDAGTLCAPGQKILPYNLPLGQRSKWAFSLIISLRRIGWTQEGSRSSLRPVTTVAPVSRKTFILRQAFESVRVYLIMDVAHGCMVLTTSLRNDPSSTENYRTFLRSIHSLAALAAAWGFTGLGYLLISIFAALLGRSDPTGWTSNIHGSWFDAYSIRSFWGRAWHQLLRRIVSAHGGFVAHDILRLRPGSILANNLARFTGFYVSGLIHSFGFHGTLKHHRADLMFYVWQAAGIGLEELCMGTLPLRLTNHTRFLGYIWVLVWFAFTLPEYTDHQFGATVEAGCNNFRLSIVMGVWKGQWVLK